MKKKYPKLICAFAAAVLCFTGGMLAAEPRSASAAETSGNWGKNNITLKNVTSSIEIKNIVSNPVTYKDNAENGTLVSASETVNTSVMTGSQTVIFTAAYPYTTTKRTGNYTEYSVEKNSDGKYCVTAINAEGDGTTYIPVGGFVLSVPKSESYALRVNDVVELGGTSIAIADKAVESESGSRVAIDLINGNRSAPMVVYYDYDFGDKTGTNVYGTEMAAVYDETSGKFVVQNFRAFGEGDASGIFIPDNGFVLSAYGEGYRGIMMENQRFSAGDKLTMVGFDYIRFGGEAISYVYNYDYYDSQSSTDEFNSNPGRMETATSPFAAYRGTDQTIIYHDGWSYNGSAGTGTNVYGYEVAVDATGTVVERGVNVGSVPAGGYVISGHGKGRDFIRSNIPLGATVSLDASKKTYYVTTSLNSYYVSTKAAVEDALSAARKKIAQLYDIDTEAANRKIEEARTELDKLLAFKEDIEAKTKQNTWSAQEKTNALMAYNTAKLKAESVAQELTALSAESKPVTARAVWHRPTEKTLEALTETLDTYRDTGINLILLETFFNGYSMFRSDYVEYHKDFVSASYGTYKDYVSAFTALAAERGIEVHAWVEDFYVGLSTDVRLLREHEDWIVYNDDGTIYQRKEGGAYIFIDPSNKATGDFLIAYYKELVEKNPLIKGLNLDYIRYPVSTQKEDTGYTKNAMLEFAASVGVADKLNASSSVKDMITAFRKWVLNSNYNAAAEENYKKWCDYRVNAVNAFVERVNKEVKGESSLLLSTAVFSSPASTLEQKKQDWRTWIANGWIDIATPMAYYDSSVDVLQGVADMILISGGSCYYYTGLASSFRGLPAYENVNQIEASYLGGADGYAIFCSTQIIGHDDVQKVLKAGYNSAPAVLPHAQTDKILKAYFDTMLDRADRLYIPAGGMNEEQKSALEAKFRNILSMPYSTAEELGAIGTAVKDIAKTSSLRKLASGYAQARLSESLSELSSLLERKQAMLEAKNPSPDPVPDPVGPGKDEDNANGKKKGCKSSFGAGAALITLVAAGVTVCARGKKRGE